MKLKWTQHLFLEISQNQVDHNILVLQEEVDCNMGFQRVFLIQQILLLLRLLMKLVKLLLMSNFLNKKLNNFFTKRSFGFSHIRITVYYCHPRCITCNDGDILHCVTCDLTKNFILDTDN